MKKIHSFGKSLKNYFVAHKFLSIVIILVVIGVGYKIVKAYTSTAGETRYITGTVQRQTLITSITGSGQVAASNQVDLKSKASGDITSINVQNGQEIKAGDIIAIVDSQAAANALENARISYQKLIKPADAVTSLQAEDALSSAIESKTKSEDSLTSDYVAGVAAISSTFGDIPTIINSMQSAFYDQGGYLSNQNVYSFTDTARQYRDDAAANYDIAKNKYDAALINFKNLNSNSPTTTIESVINQVYDMTLSLSLAVKDAKNTADFIQNSRVNTGGNLTTFQSDVTSWSTKVNSHLNDLSSARNAIINDKTAVSSAARSIAEKNESLVKLKNGPDSLDLRSELLNLHQKESDYADRFIRAPFDGIVAKVNVKLADSISSGASVATFITKDKTATLSLNEVDVSKIKVDDKVTLTFDAIDGLSLTGKVADIDLVGTVSQGVVTYNVKIAFDTDDVRVKPGMSVSAAIITSAKPDVLAVPNSAIKTLNQGGALTSYVEMFSSPLPPAAPGSGSVGASGVQGSTSSVPPRQQIVQVGDSNDTSTEIISGLKEGDQIVTRTITAAAAKTTTASPSLFGGGARTGGGAGAVRRVGG